MRAARSIVAAFAVLAALLMAPGRAKAQAVAFFPTVGQIPDGVSLNVTPVVSADRRYVRLSLDVNFSTINGFSNFPVPAAVGGGNGTGGLGGGLGGLGGGLGEAWWAVAVAVVWVRVAPAVRVAATPWAAGSATSGPAPGSPIRVFPSAPNSWRPAARPPPRQSPTRRSPSGASPWPTPSSSPEEDQGRRAGGVPRG